MGSNPSLSALPQGPFQETLRGRKTPADYTEYINKWGTAEKVSVPTLTPHLLENGTMHTAMLVIPGGGYANVAVALEGEQIAIALNYISCRISIS